MHDDDDDDDDGDDDGDCETASVSALPGQLRIQFTSGAEIEGGVSLSIGDR